MFVDLQTAKFIEFEMKNKKAICYTDEKDYVFGTHYVKYIYSDNNVKNNHVEAMKLSGWEYLELGMSNEPIYVNLYNNGKDDIYLPCGIFFKKIDSLFGN